MIENVHVIFHHAHLLAEPARWIHIPVLDSWHRVLNLRDPVHVMSHIAHGARGIARGILDLVHVSRDCFLVASDLARVVSNLVRVVSNLVRVVAKPRPSG
jgi:hypothetical protein